MNDGTTKSASEDLGGFELLMDESLDNEDASGTDTTAEYRNGSDDNIGKQPAAVTTETATSDGELESASGAESTTMNVADMPSSGMTSDTAKPADEVNAKGKNAPTTGAPEFPKVDAAEDTIKMPPVVAPVPMKNSASQAKRGNVLAPQPTNTGKNNKLDKKKKRSNKKRIVWAVVVALFALGVIGGYFALQGIGIPVTTARAEVGDVAITVFATGAITSGESSDVYPETQGIINAVVVSEGDTVEEGAILATLDDTAAQAQLSQAEAGLAQARAGLQQAEAGRDQAAAGQTQARAGVSAAQAALDAARSGLETARGMETLSQDVRNSAQDTVRNMRAAGIAAADPAAFAQAEAALQQAEASLVQASGGVAQARAGVSQAEAALAQARAGQDSARAAETGSAITAAQAGVSAAEDGVALAQAALDATVIRAPKDGMVLFAPTAAGAAAMGSGITPTSGTELMAGSAVAPGSPLFTVVNENALSFTAEIDEVDVRKISVGQTAEVTLSSYSGRTFRAEVNTISSVAKPTLTGGTVFEVELIFDEDIPDTRIGMRGDTSIEIETRAEILTIPIDAWFSEGGENFVYTIDGEGRLVRTPIVTGASTEFVVEIGDGLSEGDIVVMASGVAVPLEEGLPVTPAATP